MQGAKASHGGASILPYSYGGSNGLLTQDNFDARLWRRFGTSRLARTLCAAPTGAANMALYGKMPSVTYQDYPEAALIILWGVNPSSSGIHLIPFVREAQKRGAKLVVVDPRSTQMSRAADVHLAVKPGTDVAVALAIHRHLFTTGRADEHFLRAHTHGVDDLRARAEEWTFDKAAMLAGISPADIERVAELYASSSPALIRCGWGLERNRNGGNAALAVLALPTVGGKFGVRGGGYSMSNSASWNIERPWIDAQEPATRLVNMNHLGRALTEYDDPPVKVLFVYNCNPAATVPDQRRVLKGLERDDLFTVVFEQVMTDTALYADIILPNTTFLEGYDFAKAYGPLNIALANPVIEAVGETRSNADVFGELCGRLGFVDDGQPSGELDLLVSVLDQLPGTIGADLRSGVPPVPPFGSAPDPVRGRVSQHGGSQGRSLPRRTRGERARRAVPLSARSGDRQVSADAHLALERADHQLDARRAAAPRREADDAPRRRRRTRPRRRRSGADLQRSRRSALPGVGLPDDPPWHGQPAERPVAAQHAERVHGNRAGARHPDRSGRGRLLQRRARAGRFAADSVKVLTD